MRRADRASPVLMRLSPMPALIAYLVLSSGCDDDTQVTRQKLTAACVAASAELDSIRLCSEAAECGQVLPYCSGIAAPVVRLDADPTKFLELQRRVTTMLDRWTEPLPTECMARGLETGGTCDCVRGVACTANRCERECF